MSRRTILSLLPIACLVLLASCAHRAHKPTTTAPAASGPPMPVGVTLLVDVADLRSRQGQLLICVFDRPAGFPTDTSRAVMSQVRILDPRSGGLVRVGFALPPATYAVAVFHDENRSGKLNPEVFAVPNDGMGVSNNPKPHAGPATFDEAKFVLPPSGTRVVVGMRY